MDLIPFSEMHQLVADSSDPIPKPTILLGVLNMAGKDELVAFVLAFLGTIIAPIHFIEATMLHDLGLVECRLWDLIFQLWIAYNCSISSGSNPAWDASPNSNSTLGGYRLATAEISSDLAGCFLKLLDHL